MSNPTSRTTAIPASGAPLDRAALLKIQSAVNQVKGHHGEALVKSMVVSGTERLLLLGPQTTPAGVTIQLLSGAVMQTL